MLSIGFLILAQATPGPPAALEQSFKIAAAWEVCAILQGTNYASLKEEVDVLADAALSKCDSAEGQFRSAVSQLTINEQGQGFDSEHINALVRDERARVRGKAVTAILDARLDAQKTKK